MAVSSRLAFGVAGHDGRAAVAARADRLARIEQQAPFRLARLRRMALVAVLDEDRPDLRLEERDALGGVLLLRFRGAGHPCAQQQPGCPTAFATHCQLTVCHVPVLGRIVHASV